MRNEPARGRGAGITRWRWSAWVGLFPLWATLAASCAPAPSAPPPSPAPLTPTVARLGPTSTASPAPTTGPSRTPTATLVPIPTPSPLEPSRGPARAAVTLILYSDFDCNLCAQIAQTVSQVQQDHPQDLRYLFRPFPLLAVNEKSAQAAAALVAAGELGAYWEMHDELFQRRSEWAGLSVAEFRRWLLADAPALGLDPGALDDGMSSPSTLAQVEAAYRQARSSGIPGVPFVLVNGRPHLLPLDHTHLEAAVRLALLREHQYDGPPAVELDRSATYRARLLFDVGPLTVHLYPGSAPQGVASFLFLAEHGWYDDTILYRIVPGQVVEGGDPTGTGLADAGYHFDTESDPALRFDRAGMVGLVNEGPGTNSARFFITFRPRPDLDGSHTIIGRVIDGLERLEGLDPREPIEDLLTPPQATLKQVVIEAQ